MEDDIVRFDRNFYEPYTPDTADDYSQVSPDIHTEAHKEKQGKDLSTLIATMDVDLAKPNTELSDHHVTNAQMANAVKIASSQGIEQAQEYLYENGIEKSIVDSSRYGLMLRDDVDPLKHTLALRGMNPNDPRDIYNASLQFSGSNESRTLANAMIDKVEASGGQIEHIASFSMGSADALDIAMERGINATCIDPPLNPRHVAKNTFAIGKPRADIEILRNPQNVLSMGTSMRNVSLNPQYRVSVVRAGKEGVLASHELMPNFGKKQIDKATMEAEKLVKVGTASAQHDTMIAMREAMNETKSFTEFYRELNSTDGVPSHVDVDVDGIYNKLGSRVNNEAPLVKMWKVLDGKFNEAETSHLNNARPASQSQQIIADDDVIQHLRDGDVETARTKSHDRFVEGMKSLNEDEVMSHPAVQSSVGEAVKSAIHPVNMATGTLSAFAGNTAMRYIDPSGSFGQYNETGVVEHSAVSGGLTGIFSDVFMTGLAGEGLLSASMGTIALGTTAGAVAGEATRYGIDTALDKAGANNDTKESLSDIGGGLVGGATVAVATDVATIGTAMLLGTEVGAVGGVVGMAVGAGLGATFGAMAYGLGKLNQVPEVAKAEHQVASGVKKGWKKFKGLFD